MKIPNLISLDIGGTSTDVAQIYQGKGGLRFKVEIDGIPVATPAVDIKTIGAGGGSIARVHGGILRVGPESAGANPGPVAYNKGGTEVTVTDADLIFGVLGTQMAGGELELNKDTALSAIEKIAQKLDLSISETIDGVRKVFHENIAGALRAVSTERGHDPRQYSLLAFGGAGPVHAVELAELLKISTVIVPPYPGIWSAFGLLAADYRYDKSHGLLQLTSSILTDQIVSIYKDLHQKISNEIEADGLELSVEGTSEEELVLMRYYGQSFELQVPWMGTVKNTETRFHELHREYYGFSPLDEPTEIVALKFGLVIPHPTPMLPDVHVNEKNPEPIEWREIKTEKVPVFTKPDLGKGWIKEGPVIIDQLDTTTYVPNGWRAEIMNWGFIKIRRNGI